MSAKPRCGTVLFSFWLVATQLSAASVQASDQVDTDQEHSQVVQTPLTPTDKVRAQQWHLSASEWQRYQSLLQGIRGSVSPASLSPIEVLGIHARTTEERHRYAEQWAMLMREDAERILAFQHAYDEAQQRLFPGEPLINAVQLALHRSNPETASHNGLIATDRVLFFTATDCVVCDAVLDRLLGKLPTIAGIDIYLLDVAVGNEDRIREWAGRRHIDPEWVRERRVTLNVDAGALDALGASLGKEMDQRPAVLRRHGDAVLPLSSSQF